MKVALIQCPGWGRDCPPYTVALLSAWLRAKGHKAFGFDLNNTLYCSGPDKYRKMWDDKDMYSFWNNTFLISEFIRDNERMIDFQVNKILDTGAKIIGFTVHFSSLLVSLEFARRIKRIDSQRIIVFGGPDCCRELRGLEIIKEEAVDIVVVGEGDEILPELADILEAEGHVEFSQGVLLKKNGKVIDCGDRPVLKYLDMVPFPDYSDFSEDILSGHYRQPERLDIFDSRGCITGCHFCSEWQFWKAYRSMSGDRIYEEVAYQIKKFPGVNYFYFIGSLLNGNIIALSRFCDLIIQNDLKIRWAGQAVIRTEMNKELLEKMKKAGCEWLGYGIESGSQKVVDSMNKHFSVKNAGEVLRDTHQAGIGTQINIMFGIPTEEEDDFRQTLEFLKRNRGNVDSVLASQSFCVIDKGTYLHSHAEEFGIKNADHHLYWEANGNNYAERFRRYEEFCQLALSLGLPETSGVLRVKPDKWMLLGDYYLFKKNYPCALECFQKSLELESANNTASQKIEECRREMGVSGKAGSTQDKKVTGFAEVVLEDEPECLYTGLNETQEKIKEALARLGHQEKLDNYLLVEREKQELREYVHGFPYWLTIDPANYCTLKCPFCPTGQDRGSREKGMLPFENFKKLADELGPYLIHIDFCNWGEPLLNNQVYGMIKYAKQYNVDTKVDSNLNHFSEKDAEDMILSGLDRLIVSIDGASRQTYSKYRIGGDFNKVINNLKILIRKRRELDRANPYISWQFLVFRHNEHEIEDVKMMGRDLGVDSVGITKAFIGDKSWIPLNEEYSHYKKDEIKEEFTSEHFKTPQRKICNWPWEAIVINPNGSVSVCCSVEDEKDDFGNIFEAPFKDIWNNDKYRQARRFIKNREGAAKEGNNICSGCRHLGLTNIDILTCQSLFKLR
ncbi:MAG: radical SAM protein [Candidatus Omnitrophica bacterium]|nr:radical SAM protein [Candidatus Omnitrophota bacterium]